RVLQVHESHCVDTGISIAPIAFESGQVRLGRLPQIALREDTVTGGVGLLPEVLVHPAPDTERFAAPAALLDERGQDPSGLIATPQPVKGEPELLADHDSCFQGR